MRAIQTTIEAAARVNLGILPVAGGWLDQAAACMDGMDVVWEAERRIEERVRKGKEL